MKKHHPEQQDDEIYMGNEPVNALHSEQIGWLSRRTGESVVSCAGRDCVPVFVLRSEIEADIAARKDRGEPEDRYNTLQDMLDAGTALL